MQHYTVTLTTQNVAYKLLTLVKAINTSFVDNASQIIIQSDKSNTGNVYLGGSTVTATDYGVVLPSATANSSVNLTAGQANGTTLQNMYILADTANSQKAHILILP